MLTALSSGETMSRIRIALLAAAITVTLGCASPATAQAPTSPVSDTLVIGGNVYDVDWYLPPGPAAGFAVIEHGFTRHCANVRQTTERMQAMGLLVLCVNANLAFGNPGLADALAELISTGLTTPDGQPVPQRVVVGGHSAGGAFAVRLGWKLSQIAPERLAGAVMFDPVSAGGSFNDELRAIGAAGRRPVLVVSANGGSCNAQNNSYPALRLLQDDARAAGRDSFVGVQLTDRSTHVDVEGRDGDVLAWAACRQGPARAYNTESLRLLTSQWALDAVTGQRQPEAYPGGAWVEDLRAARRAVVIE
jgi:pimeloyl-ACP methyl ester carboxylesterase